MSEDVKNAYIISAVEELIKGLCVFDKLTTRSIADLIDLCIQLGYFILLVVLYC
jgi:hypothetical protein